MSKDSDPPSPSRWLRLGEAARLLNLSESYLRKGTTRKKNPIPCIRLGEGGERRFNYGELCRHFGIKDKSPNGEVKTGEIWLYLRISSPAQKTSLVNQRAMALEEVCKREGVAGEDVHVVEEVKSAFSGRDKFNDVIWALIQGKVKRVYYCYASRWSRVGCLTRLTEFLAVKLDVELVPLWQNDGEAAKETSGYDFQEALDYLQVIVNTQNGHRAAKVNSVVLPEDTISEIHRLHQQGTPGSHIQRILEEGGHRSLNPSDGIISYYSINKILTQNKAALETVLPAPTKSSWEIFSESRLIYEGPESSLRLKKSELYSAYCSYCTKNDLLCLSARKIGSLTNTIPRKYTNTGRVALVGCRLKNGDNVGE